MAKKSFLENAKGFFSSFKKEHNEENKDIIERKKKRDEHADEMKKEFFETLNEVKIDLEDKSKDVVESLTVEFDKFSDSLKKGTATIQEKLEVEKRFDQLKVFLDNAKDIGEEKIDKMKNNISNLSDFDEDLTEDNNKDDKDNVDEKK